MTAHKAKTTKRGRPRALEPTVQANYRFPQSIAQRLDTFSTLTDIPKTRVMVDLLDAYLPQKPVKGLELLT